MESIANLGPCLIGLQALRVQGANRSDLAELPGLRARCSALQQQLTRAEEARAEAVQAAAEAREKLHYMQTRLNFLAKVRMHMLHGLGRMLYDLLTLSSPAPLCMLGLWHMCQLSIAANPHGIPMA